jgi:hypothetical protein
MASDKSEVIDVLFCYDQIVVVSAISLAWPIDHCLD